MSAELIDELRSLATRWDDAAPAITLDDLVREPVTFGEDPPTSPEVTMVGGSRRPRRWWVAVAAAASVALVVVAVAVMRSGEPERRIEPPVESSSTSTAATSTVATSTTEPSEEAVLARVVDEVAQARSSLDAFTATVTVSTSNPTVDASGALLPPDTITHTNRVTMLSDGSLWSEGDQIVWSSFDPSTGTARNATVDPDGVEQYQEVVGWADASVPVNILFGVDPFADVYGIVLLSESAGVTQSIDEVTSHLDRPAWRITQSTTEVGDNESDGVNTFASTWDIDRGTGIVVAYSNVQTFNGAEQRTDSKVTELTVGSALPAAFPGTFPDGATVGRSGDPNGFVPVTLQDAATRFGRGIYVPTSFRQDPRVAVTTQRTAFGGSAEPNATMVQVEIVQRTGFTTASITMSEYVPDPGAPLPKDMTLEDGLWCFTPAGQPCGGTADNTVITAGDLAGAPSAVEGAIISATVGGVSLTVRASTPDASLALANSLVRVDPPA